MVTTAERAEELLKKIKKENKNINALLHINENVAKEAKEVDRKIKQGNAGLLAGKFIAVKSCISVADLPVTCGSRVLENYRGSFDADVVARIREEDGIIIGMANMDEFACGSSGENSAFGATKNPAAPALIPGGSSSGSTAAVAAGFCDMALGTETGGSIRNPASHCGVFGLKPSYGRVSRSGLVDLSMSLDQIGPVAASTQDLALLTHIISGQSQNDATTFNRPPVSSQAEAKKLKIGIVREFTNMCMDREIVEQVDNAVDILVKETGAKTVDVKMAHVNLAVQTYYPLVYVEFFSGTRKFDGRKYGRKIEDYCGEEVLRRILGGREISKAEHHGTYYRKALKAKKMIAQEINSGFDHADVIVLPTTPMLPHKLGKKITDPRVMYAYDAYTIPANLAGCCAGVAPAERVKGAPVGVQVMAPAFREELLLSTLAAFENHLAETL